MRYRITRITRAVRAVLTAVLVMVGMGLCRAEPALAREEQQPPPSPGSLRLQKNVVYPLGYDVDKNQRFSFSGDLGTFTLAHTEANSFTNLAS